MRAKFYKHKHNVVNLSKLNLKKTRQINKYTQLQDDRQLTIMSIIIVMLDSLSHPPQESNNQDYLSLIPIPTS